MTQPNIDLIKSRKGWDNDSQIIIELVFSLLDGKNISPAAYTHTDTLVTTL